jgi:hypothetical protein
MRKYVIKRCGSWVCLVVAIAMCATTASGQVILGTPLPAAPPNELNAGASAPDYASTFITPYTVPQDGVITSWKTDFVNTSSGPGYSLPAGVQLKIFRGSGSVLTATAASPVYNPLTVLNQHYPTAAWPYTIAVPFANLSFPPDFAPEFTDTLSVRQGDVVGFTVFADQRNGAFGYYMPVVDPAPAPGVCYPTRGVERDVPVGGTVDLTDPFTGCPPTPALEIHFVAKLQVQIDIKPGSFPNSINLSSAGVVPVAILSDQNFDALTVVPESVSLAGARVALIGKASKYSCHAEDVNGDGRPDLVCQVSTAQFLLQPGDTEATLEGQTSKGQLIYGSDSVRIVPDSQ